MNRKLWIIGIVVGIMLVAVSAVGAQEQPPAQPNVGGAQQEQPAQPNAGGQGGGSPMAQMMRRGVLRLAAEQTGLTVRELMDELHSGKSLGDVLTAHGVESSAFVDAAAAQLQERLDRAVTRGRITQEQADEVLSNFRERLTERLTVVPPVSA